MGAASHSPCVPAVPGHFSALLVSDGRCPRRGLAASAHRGFAPLLSPPREGGQAAPAARGTPAHGGCSAPPPRAQRGPHTAGRGAARGAGSITHRDRRGLRDTAGTPRRRFM